ncbi:MAG: NotI family restriction endonuclease [Rubrobacteraceae bacterium]
MANNPLFEVFGFPPDDMTEEAKRHREKKLCPFNNKVLECTKDKAGDPLGVCSIVDRDSSTIICPIRFRQNWRVAADAAEFFGFSPGSWTVMREVRLNDKNGRSAGNIDLVIVDRDERGRLRDFGSVEVQAVYISGNVRRPFEHYMNDPEGRQNMNWTATQVRADYLSSSRKRLMPQLIYKGEILKAWGKKQTVAIHRTFFETLPKPPTVSREEAEMAWFVYDLSHNSATGGYGLTLVDTVYTEFEPALLKITSPEPGPVNDFVEVLQRRLDKERSSSEAWINRPRKDRGQ